MDDDQIQWWFVHKSTLIAEIYKQVDSMTVYDDVLDGRFRDRLKLDNQTGSLTITNTRIKHVGYYVLQINSVSKSFYLSVYGEISVTEAESVTLNADLTEIMDDDQIQWRFFYTLIAEINKRVDNITVNNNVLDGTFRDRLKLDNQTGSLTITNFTTEHNGVYYVAINRISIHFFLAVYDEISVTEGDSVTLNCDLTKMKAVDQIQWSFSIKNSFIAGIFKQTNSMTVYDDVLDGRFRDRLKLNNQTGSLTITNITTQHAGNYKLSIFKSKISSKAFRVSVYARLPFPVISRYCSSSSSSSYCSLLCSVLNVRNVTLSWYKGNSLLSSISVSNVSISFSLHLEVEYQDKNSYSCVLNNPISNQTTHLDITQLCHTCSGTAELILVMLVLI
uniref:Ig-like domain-containing protein n=1 Tax=Cyprinus carpio TaxID=7962 RepID=A0A8C1L8G5_CYPCA